MERERGIIGKQSKTEARGIVDKETKPKDDTYERVWQRKQRSRGGKGDEREPRQWGSRPKEANG